jgi:hypothetical protein
MQHRNYRVAQISQIAYLVPEFMITHTELNEKQVRQLIHKSIVTIAGNRNLKIFGKLNCRSGKRMKKINRIFFESVQEALRNNFRPCGHCMKPEYNQWKNESLQ